MNEKSKSQSFERCLCDDAYVAVVTRFVLVSSTGRKLNKRIIN